MTHEEEALLIRAVQAGNEAAECELVQANRNLLVNVAKICRNLHEPFEDQLERGKLGLLQAAMRFDPEKGFRFSTYATHVIKQAIQQE